ncbi:MAG TPA: SDR family NAD(P)-dependent oxidoreductase [Chromatiales bacterium]|nr:SDR family NAD(P)-dependent oxidoreductase [Chromatiales bacterium]
MPPDNRTVLVTGASSGIGRATCARLIDEGYRVIGLARDFSKLGDAITLNATLRVDLGKLDELAPELADLTQAHPQITDVVCCAGRGRFGSLEEFSTSQIRALIDLNLTSTIMLIRALLPQLKRNGHGDIVVIGSESAVKGGRMGAVYCASKFGLRGFLQSLRYECASANVRTTLINPGMVDTAFFDSLGFAPGDAPDQAIQAADVAETIVGVLATRPGTVIDEINLSPLKHVVRGK